MLCYWLAWSRCLSQHPEDTRLSTLATHYVSFFHFQQHTLSNVISVIRVSHDQSLFHQLFKSIVLTARISNFLTIPHLVSHIKFVTSYFYQGLKNMLIREESNFPVTTTKKRVSWKIY